jgi:hypothetical protein
MIIQRPSTEPSVLANGVIPTIRDADAIILRNGGTATVNLWYGLYTLAPGETISFNVTVVHSKLELVDVPVNFDTSTGSVKLLQIITIKSANC